MLVALQAHGKGLFRTQCRRDSLISSHIATWLRGTTLVIVGSLLSYLINVRTNLPFDLHHFKHDKKSFGKLFCVLFFKKRRLLWVLWQKNHSTLTNISGAQTRKRTWASKSRKTLTHSTRFNLVVNVFWHFTVAFVFQSRYCWLHGMRGKPKEM